MMIVRVLTLILLVVVAFLVTFLLLRLDGPGSSGDDTAARNETKSEQRTEATPVKAPLALFYVAMADEGKVGERIGCGDSLVPTLTEPVETNDRLKAALDRLLAGRDSIVSGTELYNSLYEADLSVTEASVKNDVATVRLTGELLLRGTCDTPRAEAQLTETIKAAAGTESAEVFLNGETLREALSEE